jgi:hypothetical protein
MPSLRIDQVKNFDNLSAAMFSRLQNFVEGSVSNVSVNLGFQFYLKAFLYKTIGSVDYLNKITLDVPSWNPHPLSLIYIQDNIDYGYINADIEGFSAPDTTVLRTKVAGLPFTSFPPPPILSWLEYNDPDMGISDLDIEYPEWDGWPVRNAVLPDRPILGATTLPVFFCAKYIQITPNNGGVDITDADPLLLDVSEEIKWSLWDAYDDVKLYHFTTYDYVGAYSVPKTEPQITPFGFAGAAEECKRSIDPATGIMIVGSQAIHPRQGHLDYRCQTSQSLFMVAVGAWSMI